MNAASSEDSTGRLIQDQAHDGVFNMAADLFLVDYARVYQKPVLRLYTWERPTLSLGFHQQLSKDQLDYYNDREVPIVRRPTGGRAILHDQELTYALALPENHPLLQEGKGSLLKRIGQAFVLAAARLGCKAELVRAGDPIERLQRGSPLCFDSVSRWEVRLGGRKWVGSAQRILPEAFLQHGSILLGYHHPEFLGLRLNQLRQVLPDAFQDTLGIHWQEENFSDLECTKIKCQLQVQTEPENSKVA